MKLLSIVVINFFITLGVNAMQNPLLENKQFPEFSQIESKHFEPAIDSCLKEYKAKLNSVLEKNPSWENTVEPLDQIDNKLTKVWNIINHLNNVNSISDIQQAYEKVLPKVVEFNTELMQNEKLYKAYEAILNSPGFKNFSKAKRTTIEHAVRDFKLSGVALPIEKREEYKKLVQLTSQLGNKFSQNVLKATDSFKYKITDESELSGLPDYVKNQAKEKKELGLDFPTYHAVMAYSDNRELRKVFYTAYNTKASSGDINNETIIKQIVEARDKKSKLLGFNNYAEYSLVPKMAKDSKQVMEFLNELAVKSKPIAIKEFKTLQDFAEKEYKLEKLEAWDIGYISEKYKHKHYDFSEEELRKYFNEKDVLNGMFNLVNKLYGMSVTEVKNIPIWHESVKLFLITDKNNNKRGYFYTDLYARKNKRGGAWMADLDSRYMLPDNNLQLPIAFLEANFTPEGGLSHDEVITLFHEFGHTLHHVLTQVDTLAVSGISGVSWDAVELPSQFMENFCWEWDVIKNIANNMPKELFDKLLATKNYQAAMQMVRQLEFALFDFKLHMQDQSKTNKTLSAQEVLNSVRVEVAVVPIPDFNKFQNGFTHIFDGGYAAGYYSYKWAEVLSSDVFELFKENGTISSTIGNKFLTTVLEQGGSKESMDLFIEFRGREPSIEPLLKHSGILPAA